MNLAEKISAGMVMAGELSGLDDDDKSRLKRLVASAGLPTVPPPAGSKALRDAMDLDKKVQHKQVRFVLLKALGESYITSDYDDARLLHILEATD